MTQRRLTDLPTVLRKAGLKVVEVPGWENRSRPASTGDFNPIGNLWHHTGAKDTNPLSIEDDLAYARWLAEVGRADLPAPLCQLSVGRNGTIYVCAAGRGNHAGVAKPSGQMPGGDGNAIYVGWECQNDGTEGWTGEQYEAMVKGAAATSKAYGWTAFANRAHKETSITGKWDPGALDMDEFRADIAEAMAAPVVTHLRQDILDAIKATKQAKAASEKPRRPRVRAKLKQGLKKLREALALEKG